MRIALTAAALSVVAAAPAAAYTVADRMEFTHKIATPYQSGSAMMRTPAKAGRRSARHRRCSRH